MSTLPLVLKDHLDESSEMCANILAITKKHKGKGKGKGQYVESDESDDDEMDEGLGTVLPQSPKSAAVS